MEILTEEQYLERHGLGMAALGDVSLHRQPGGTPKSIAAAAKRQSQRDYAWQRARERLRQEYAEKVAEGSVRPPTRHERLRRAASGNPDNPSTQAARRVLARMGDGEVGAALDGPVR